MRLGYGITMFEGLYTGTPELGLGLSNTGREYSVGWRLAESPHLGLVFGFDVKGSRHESVDSDAKPENRLTIGLGWRLGTARRENVHFEARFEASRIDVANDDRAPEHRVGLRVMARW